MNMESKPHVVQFPLQGEWVAALTPAEKVPSHGTHQFGQTFAYDFIKIAWHEKAYKFFTSSTLRFLILGTTLGCCLGYGETVFSPFGGTVVDAFGNSLEQNYLHPILTLLRVYKNKLGCGLN